MLAYEAQQVVGDDGQCAPGVSESTGEFVLGQFAVARPPGAPQQQNHSLYAVGVPKARVDQQSLATPAGSMVYLC